MRPARVSNFILICAHSKIRIAKARVGFKAANRESFPYIMQIVDEPRKFSPSNVLTYTVYNCPLYFKLDHEDRKSQSSLQRGIVWTALLICIIH